MCIFFLKCGACITVVSISPPSPAGLNLCFCDICIIFFAVFCVISCPRYGSSCSTAVPVIIVLKFLVVCWSIFCWLVFHSGFMHFKFNS